ncbi:NAD kinase [Cohaesibacter celericrescens]|uniref:NAD kinase n=1 Tax=Cohaesibacter celericrescens TaxID=2067669 RepID=A0A2N5XW23_9HYPH|nr:NAD kinase [Cohaesibacter celericrescens]PLW78703.1 NAD kinase [Cohaesibacter celericrescens]
MSRPFENIAFISSTTEETVLVRQKLAHRFGSVPPDEADVIVALGGDGLMLQTLHRHMNSTIPIYGMNCGSIGFLMNEYGEDGLIERLENAELSEIRPLHMSATTSDGKIHEALAINEISVFRQTAQAAKLEIQIDDKVRMEELICDGALVATPTGSTAYNLSAHGPILPIDSPLLALTPISPFRPRHWRGALLANSAKVKLVVKEPNKRPLSAVADHTEIRSVLEVEIREDTENSCIIMFDPEHGWAERILTEQFRY